MCALLIDRCVRVDGRARRAVGCGGVRHDVGRSFECATLASRQCRVDGVFGIAGGRFFGIGVLFFLKRTLINVVVCK